VDRKIDGRFDSLDRKIDSRFDTLDQKIDQRFMWTIGVVLSTWLTTILAVFLRH
jgi:tetrahydromethanopterin S-methyltransferase subunit G